MYMHQQYNWIISKQKYALRGSKLSCSYGSDFSLFDIGQDHGIYKGNLPVMTTIDSGKTNIYHFGSCLCPESNYAGRLPMTAETLQNGKKAKKATNNKYAHICVPMVPEGSVWKQVDHSIMAKTCAKGYAPLLLDNAVLVCQYGGLIRIVEVPQTGTTKGVGNVPSDVLGLMNALIDSTWGISDSAAEAWFLSTNTAVITKYGLNSTNISNVTVAIKAAGVSPVLFYAYTVNEGGGLGGFINHYGKNYYASNGGDTAVNAASGDAQYLADQFKIMNSRPAWVDLGQKPPLRIDFVPQSVKDSGNANFAGMPSGSIGRAYIPATAASTWEVYYPDGLLKSYNQVQNYGAPMK